MVLLIRSRLRMRPLELLDPDAEQFFVLALDLAPARFVLGEVGFFLMLIGFGDADVQVHLRLRLA